MAKIIGTPIATPLPKPDWNQKDSTKGDYIKNKPNISERDRARFDNSFNYIAYSEMTDSNGCAANSKEHFEWVAKQQGFTALKGDVRPTLQTELINSELIMCHDSGFTISGFYTKDEEGNEASIERPVLYVDEDGYLTDGKHIYDGTTAYDGKTYHAYIGESYVSFKNAGTYYEVTKSDEGYILNRNTTVPRTTILAAKTKDIVVGAYTDKGQEVYYYTNDGGATKTYYTYAYTFGIRKLCKEQCFALLHSNTGNHVCSFDTYVKTCKKYGKIIYATIRDEDIESLVAPKMFEILDKYNVRKNSVVNSFNFQTLKSVRNLDNNIMLSRVLPSSWVLSEQLINDAIYLGNCLICCVDSVNQWKVLTDPTHTSYNAVQAAIKLAKKNDIRLYEAQVTSADEIDTLMECGIVGAQMTCVPDLATTNESLPLWEGGSY